MAKSQPADEPASAFIPNSYQTPNLYIDRYLSLLTPEEWLVLSYTARRIFGWHRHNHQERISLGQYATGWVVQGRRRDYGTGLSIPTVRDAIAGLKQYGLLVELEAGSPQTRTPALYTLQLDDSQVDTDGLMRRAADRHERNRKRTRKARKTRVDTETIQPDYTDTMQSHYIDTMQPDSSELCNPITEDYVIGLHDMKTNIKLEEKLHGDDDGARARFFRELRTRDISRAKATKISEMEVDPATVLTSIDNLLAAGKTIGHIIGRIEDTPPEKGKPYARQQPQPRPDSPPRASRRAAVGSYDADRDRAALADLERQTAERLARQRGG